MKLWKIYSRELKILSKKNICLQPKASLSDHNAHIYYLIIKKLKIKKLKKLSLKIPLYTHYERSTHQSWKNLRGCKV